MRLDQYLVNNKIAESRVRAKYYIKSGKVTVNNAEVTKPAFDVKEADEVHCNVSHTYVARSALKLAYAFQMWKFDIQGKNCLDIGASTGGFTEVMLKHDSKKVYALDVGHNQLHPKIAENTKVENLEGINIRELPENILKTLQSEEIAFCSIDVSFLSLNNVVNLLPKMLASGADVVALIKPQFEVGSEFIGEKGLVTNKAAINKSIERVKATAEENNISVQRVLPVPLKGGKSGNQEYLLWGMYNAGQE
jgi:23S rRNA (cytidine1920-2'-O)/16S rRNA (cytidine1409-2'-O)-methyltransferase